MTTETTQTTGGGEALPNAAETNQPPPRNDAEAAAQAASRPQETPEQKAAREDGERKRNRTREYIDRQNRRIAELAEENARLKTSNTQPAPERGASPDKEPSLEDFDYDMAAFNRAHAKWAVSQEFAAREQNNKKAEDSRKQQELVSAYQQRAAMFVEDHPDFIEVADSIPHPLSQEVQAAIMAHERGPEIAYHLGNNDDDAWTLSNTLPHNAKAAVERIVKRLTAAPTTPETPAAQTNTLAQTTSKPVTRAPQPPATVGGRSPSETPPEKLTDDEWYKRDVEKRRKR